MGMTDVVDRPTVMVRARWGRSTVEERKKEIELERTKREVEKLESERMRVTE